MARPKSEATLAREAAEASLPEVDLMSALTMLIDKSIFNQDVPTVQGAQKVVVDFLKSVAEAKNEFDQTLSARRALPGNDNYLSGVERFRKERDNTPKSERKTALDFFGLNTSEDTDSDE